MEKTKQYKLSQLADSHTLISELDFINDSYIKCLVECNFITEKAICFHILDEAEVVGYAILDRYNTHENSIIAYFKLYHSIGVEAKACLIKDLIQSVEPNHFDKFYIRVPEKEILLEKAVAEIGFKKEGIFITNKFENSFSSYSIYGIKLRA